MNFRPAAVATLAAVLAACTTTSIASNPLEKRWNGKSAGSFFAAYGPPVADRSAAGGSTAYTWRGGFFSGRSCTVELTVGKDYTITGMRALTDHPGTKGGPSHCEKALDAEG